jgi:hypothetical protein
MKLTMNLPRKWVYMPVHLHCPRAGPGRAKAIFAGPDPGPQGRATLSLALARGQADPGSVGSGQGRARVDPDPLRFQVTIVNRKIK